MTTANGMTVELEEFFEKAKKSEEFVYGPRNINTETAEGRKRALMRSDPYEWVRAGWVEQPDLYSVEAAREMCEEEAYQAAVEEDPDLADCHYNLARLYEALGKPQHAIRHLGQYRRLVTGPGN